MSDASHKSVPEWAVERSHELARAEPGYNFTAVARDYHLALARYIAEVSEAAKLASDQFANHPASAPCIAARKHLEPFILPEVDPLLIEAREVVAQTQHDRWVADSPWHANEAEQMRAGKRDGNLTVMAAHEGLKRGIEIGGAK